MAGTIKTGYGVGKTVTSYEDITVLRNKAFDLNAFITIMRGDNKANATFRGILPPKVTSDVSITGCGKLPDPSCLSSYEFNAKIDKNRVIDEIADPCDVAMLDSLITEYSANGAVAWANDEAKKAFTYIASKTVETKAKSTNVRELIEDMILEAEELAFKEMGDLAPSRDLFVVTVNNKIASDLKKLNLACCDANMVSRDNMSNDFDVKAIAKLPLRVNPENVEIMVYIPNFVFLRTMCSTNGMTHTELNQTGYAPGTHRFFAKEDYGHAIFEYPVSGTVKEIFVGVKKTGVVTP